jgi:hypothetical protein
VAENSGCNIASSSSGSDLASFPASADLGAKAGSDRSAANLRLSGRTSWDTYRYTQFAIPLACGARIVSSAKT